MKFIPILQKYSGSVIISFDSDFIYNKEIFEHLYKHHIKYPNTIISTFTLSAVGGIVNFELEQKFSSNKPKLKKMLEGYGGVLYPKIFFEKCKIDLDEALKHYFKNDDIYFWQLAVQNGIKTTSFLTRIFGRWIPVSNPNKWWGNIAINDTMQSHGSTSIDGHDNKNSPWFDYYVLKYALSNPKVLDNIKKECKKIKWYGFDWLLKQKYNNWHS